MGNRQKPTRTSASSAPAVLFDAERSRPRVYNEERRRVIELRAVERSRQTFENIHYFGELSDKFRKLIGGEENSPGRYDLYASLIFFYGIPLVGNGEKRHAEKLASEGSSLSRLVEFVANLRNFSFPGKNEEAHERVFLNSL